ncbi:MAG: hypothetical protein INR73_14935 [Williamsia sp.]|nr:hypothetical protein [Williamsia sp.]
MTKVFSYSTVLFLSLAGLTCKSTGNVASQKAMYRSIYFDQFKLTYFRRFLLKSYNYSAAIQEIINRDHSGFTEPILSDADDHLIDSLTTADNELMKIDSAKGPLRAEGAQGKRPFDYMLDKLNSKWLDSLARKRAKAFDVPKEWLTSL